MVVNAGMLLHFDWLGQISLVRIDFSLKKTQKGLVTENSCILFPVSFANVQEKKLAWHG